MREVDDEEKEPAVIDGAPEKQGEVQRDKGGDSDEDEDEDEDDDDNEPAAAAESMDRV